MPGSLTAIFPRGGESDYTLVFVDGIQLNAFGGGFDLAHLSPTNIDRIEIVRGPQSALYGSNAIGAVVRIVTRERRACSRRRVVRGGDVRHQQDGGELLRDGGRLVLGCRRGSPRERWMERPHDQRRRAGRKRRLRAYRGGRQRRLAQCERSRRCAARSDSNTTTAGSPARLDRIPPATTRGVDTISRGTDDRWGASLGASAPIRARVRTHGQVTWNTSDGEFVAASSFSPTGTSLSDSGSSRLSARAQTDIGVISGLDLSAGLEFQREEVTSTYITDDNGPIPVKRRVAGYFGEARWSPSERIFVTGGVRLEDIERDAVAPSTMHSAPGRQCPPTAWFP